MRIGNVGVVQKADSDKKNIRNVGVGKRDGRHSLRSGTSSDHDDVRI